MGHSPYGVDGAYVAAEDIQKKARRETSEERYIEFMRSRYLPKE